MYKTIRVGTGKPDVTVVGVFADQKKLAAGLKKADRDAADEARTTPGFLADPGETTTAGSGRMLVGLGKEGELKPDTLRNVGGRLVRQLDRMNAKSAALMIAESIAPKSMKADLVGRLLGEGIGLANWRVDFFDGSATKRSKPKAALSLVTADAGCRKGLEHGLALADATNTARRFAATPPNICNPTWIAKEARSMARKLGLRCQVIDFKRAQELGMGGLVNVGRASAHKPCLIILEHKPARIAAAAKGVKLAMVGKTITYDTGGYSLKISNGMKGMKYDKSGGMIVLGAMQALAELKAPVHVVALLPAAENMVAGDAYRPDDIITMYNGVSVEVTNTDAEGRLVLADALAYACDKLKPTAIVDAATLTGGVVVALGSWCAGLWCEDEPLRTRLEAASETTGERVWRLPLWEQHRDFMRAKHADLWNSGPKRDGHPIQGAAFLSYFVDPKIPWAHLDIAGTSTVDSDTDLFVQGPTGYGVRLLAEWAMGYGK